MKTLWQDVRYGLRMLLKNPSFILTAVFTIGLGIGATSAIFSFVNGVLLRPLPYQDSDRLVMLDETALKRGIVSMGVSYSNFLDWREQNQVFTGIAAYSSGGYTLTGSGEPEQLSGAGISYNTFEILGPGEPILGRTFSIEEDHPENDLVVIISHGLWERRFGAKAEILGQKLTINNRSRTVVGVMPPDFKFPDTSDLWVPLALDRQRMTRTDHGLAAIARLKAGVTLEHARSDITALARRIEEQNPVTNEGMGVSAIPLRDSLVSVDYRKALWILMGVVGLVLLIACANVANLLLARASARAKEVAIRTALGAGRWRVFRQLLTESVVLGVMGGALGLALAFWGLDLMLAAIPIDIPFWMKFEVDGRVVGFTVCVTLLTGLIFGVAPALQTSKVDLNESLKEGGRGAIGSGRHRLLRSLVIVEVALSLILLIGAGLMMRSFIRLQNSNIGFNPENLLTLRVNLPRVKYSTPEKRSGFFKDLLDRARTLPGVQAIGAVSSLPLGGNWGRSLTVEGFPVLSVGQAPLINHCVITPNYFRAMGIPILMGRDFTDADTQDSMKITIIDERLAREYWPNDNPLGKRVRFGPPENNEPWHTIVGVVGEVKQEDLKLTRRKNVYLPHSQIPINGMAIAIRSENPINLASAIRGQVRVADPDLPVTNLRTMTEVISRSVWQQRFYAILFGIFAGVAFSLASVGIYGVMAYSVSERTREIGIRMALGASRRDILRLIVAQGMTLTMIGAGVGLAAALALTRLMQTLLFEVSATDPQTFVSLVALLTFVALMACYLPARRATKVDPMVTLRCE